MPYAGSETAENPTESDSALGLSHPTTLEPKSPEDPSYTAVKDAKELLLARGILTMHNFKQERQMVKEVLRHLAPRIGAGVYQIASVSTPIISKDGMLKTFSSTTPSQVDGCYVWEMATYSAMRGGIAPLLNKFTDQRAWGLTKPLQKASEKYCRVVATIMPPFEMYLSTGPAMDVMSANFQYALIDEEGEIHPPKDTERREIKMADSETKALKQSVYADLNLMSLDQSTCKLSPKFLRLIGLDAKAAEVEVAEAEAQAQTQAEKEAKLSSKKRVLSTTCAARRTEAQERKAAKAVREREERAARRIEYPIDEILEERPASGRAISWYRVRWSGYDSSWEAWRIEGAVGEPLVTWEPLVNVRHTEAMQRWQAQQLVQ